MLDITDVILHFERRQHIDDELDDDITAPEIDEVDDELDAVAVTVLDKLLM